MKIARVSETDAVQRPGYLARYVADFGLVGEVTSIGVINVRIGKGTKTKPHAHNVLNEVFIALSQLRMGVGESSLMLEAGDSVLVEPGEKHWFEALDDMDGNLIALKLPNLSDDKIE